MSTQINVEELIQAQVRMLVDSLGEVCQAAYQLREDSKALQYKLEKLNERYAEELRGK